MNKVILLGGTGFLGKALLPLLQKENLQITTLVHKTHLELTIDSFSGDICNAGILDSQLDDGDIVVNLIGQYEKNLSQFINTNILGSINILDSAKKKKNIRIILISSITVYGENLEHLSKESDELNPKTTYGLVKMITEQIYQNFSKSNDMDITILRLSTLYGPFKKTGFIPNLIDSINNNTKIAVNNNGNQIRDMLFVDDAANGIIQAIKNPQKKLSIFNISSSKQHKIIDIIKIVEEIMHKKSHFTLNNHIPDEKCLSADNSLAKLKLGFIPYTSIHDGLKITIDYMKKLYKK